MKIVDPKTGEEKQITVSADDGIRPDTSLSVLAKLKPAFSKDGSTTAGTSPIILAILFCGHLDFYTLNICTTLLNFRQC